MLGNFSLNARDPADAGQCLEKVSGPPGRSWAAAAFLETYERDRPLPEDYRRYFATFAAMQRVASVNRQLELLDSEDADRRPPRYLKDSVPWLQSNYLERRG